MTLLILLGFILAHWIGDFALQTHWQAINKSSNNEALLNHVSTYTGVMTLAVLPLTLYHYLGAPNPPGSWFGVLVLFALITFATHALTDAITSRISGGLYKAHDGVSHDFFVVIGFDQVVHYTTLGATLYLLGLVS